MQKKKTPRGPIYAVVDLETTGTNVKKGDRIIQIGCVLVQDGRLINHFETKVNPEQPIARSISQLTGIWAADVKAAPLFEEVAPTLQSLLADTIFVAHNVNFDFPFLNAEFQRIGLPKLQIPAVDTVSLSQLLLPTAKSYRLRDLSAKLQIEHDQPHSAVSDAEATAHLLIDLLQRLQALPTLTLNKLVALQLQLPLQTRLLLDRTAQQRQSHPVALDDAHYVSHGLVLHKKQPLSVATPKTPPAFPLTKRQKQRLFGDLLTYRPLQAKMMNAIYNYFTRDHARQIMIEAGTGVGKSLGYLVPLTYLAQPTGKVIVATATNLLQSQLMTTALPQLRQLLPDFSGAVMVKGNAHYLSLSKFAHSLTVNEDSQLSQFLKAQLLVWLLTTTTGDLDELNLTAQKSPYLAEVRHTGLANLASEDPFYRDDFLVYRQRQLAYAPIIVTNQAYLVAHAAELGALAPTTYLVVDEAQHLAQSVLKQARHQLAFAEWHLLLNQLAALVNPTNSPNLRSLFAKLPLAAYNVELMQADLAGLKQTVSDLAAALLTKLTPPSATTGTFIEQVLPSAELSVLLDPAHPLCEAFEQDLASLKLHFSALQHLFAERQAQWLGQDRYLMNQFASQLAQLVAVDDQLHELKRLADQPDQLTLFWLRARQGSETTTLTLTGGLLAANHFLREQVYAHFTHQLFTGATLFTSNRSAFIFDQLDLEKAAVKVKRLPEAFDYEHQAKLLVASDAPSPTDHEEASYHQYLAQTIADLAVATDCQTMVLFNSLQTIEAVYGYLRQTAVFNQRDILAQGVNGNRAKLLKQFSSGHNSILLGAASFWEGIDLPDNQLQLLIITRLPFAAPTQLENQARYELMKQQGHNPFYHYSLPQAIIRLRQGVGRLLRTPTDTGVAVVLDPRLVTKRYGQTMQRALPAGLPQVEVPTAELSSATAAFLQTAGPAEL